MAIPISYTFWIFYRNLNLQDKTLDLDSLHTLIYSFLISPSASEVVPHQTFTWPWRAIWLAIQKLITKPDLDIWVNLTLASVFIIMVGLSWKNMRAAYRVYTLIIILVSFSYHTGPFHPYMGLPRHLMLAIPVFINASPVVNRRYIRPSILVLLGVAYVLLIYLFSLEAWIV